MPILIAITGGSGSGKSTLAEALVSTLPEGAAVLLREDSYYRDAASLPEKITESDLDNRKRTLERTQSAIRSISW